MLRSSVIKYKIMSVLRGRQFDSWGEKKIVQQIIENEQFIQLLAKKNN